MNKDNGGPAFPFVEPSTECNVSEGMTLRDYFAAEALKSIIALEGVNATYQSNLVDAQKAYSYADAMLEARKQ